MYKHIQVRDESLNLSTFNEILYKWHVSETAAASRSFECRNITSGFTAARFSSGSVSIVMVG